MDGLVLIGTDKYSDSRGFFMETYKRSDFAGGGLNVKFKQDSFSFSKKGVLRGLHYQLPPKAQDKLVRVLRGKIWDVAVDLRKKSKTFKKWFAAELSDENNLALFIPAGFAHGFVCLSDEAEVLYKLAGEYSPKHERGIIWNDAEIGIKWPMKNPLVSEKDANFPKLKEVEIFK